MTTNRRSFHLTMRDGVRIALDLFLPPGQDPVPTLLRATRYWRRIPGQNPGEADTTFADIVTGHGAAYISLDVRGTGASFGSWPSAWSADEIEDLGEVVDWIVAQPWSNGTVGSFGASYVANTAVLLAATGRPAFRVAAVAAMDFEPYSQLLCPGGLPLRSFLEQWGAMTKAMDGLEAPAAGSRGAAMFAGICQDAPVPPVDGDDGSLVAAAMREHRQNLDPAALGSLRHRDDEAGRMLGLERSTPMARWQEIAASDAALIVRAGWFDAGTALGALQAFVNLPNPQLLVIGPWGHEADTHASPFVHEGQPAQPAAAEQWPQMLGAATRVLQGHGFTGKTVRYFSLGEELWKESPCWPPQGVAQTPFSLTAGRGLSAGSATENGAESVTTEPVASTGACNRWQSQLLQSVHYGDRAAADQTLLTYTSEALEQDLEIAGTPLAELYLSSSTSAGAIFVYLEAVAPDGKVIYLTEAQLDLRQRDCCPPPAGFEPLVPYRDYAKDRARPMVPGQPEHIRLGLFPIAARIAAGHRLRMAVAAHDVASFDTQDTTPMPVIHIFHGPGTPSRIVLPVMTPELSSVRPVGHPERLFDPFSHSSPQRS